MSFPRISPWTPVCACGYGIGLVGLVLVQSFAAAAPISQTFDRYQVILDRQPFGSETALAGAGAPGGAASAAAAAVNALKMSAIIEDNSGQIVVGILDPQQNASYMLKVGETENGIELLEADYTAERAKIRKDDLERWISMNGDESQATAPSAQPIVPAVTAKPRIARAARRPAGASVSKGMTREEYNKIKSKLPPPRSAKRALMNLPDEEPMTPDEHEAVMQEYNMELIRAGGDLGPALPIPLTPEQDDQLVREGALPPTE
jgi:hypothetical protein